MTGPVLGSLPGPRKLFDVVSKYSAVAAMIVAALRMVLASAIKIAN